MFTTETINQTKQNNQMNLPDTLLQMSKGTFAGQTIYVVAKLSIALLMGDGCERTETEYRELFAAASFMVRKVVSTQAPIDVIEAVKV